MTNDISPPVVPRDTVPFGDMHVALSNLVSAAYYLGRAHVTEEFIRANCTCPPGADRSCRDKATNFSARAGTDVLTALDVTRAVFNPGDLTDGD